MDKQSELSRTASDCRSLFAKLWCDESGFIVSLELILIATILVIGLIAGLTALRDAVVSELSDVAQSVQQINQSFDIQGSSSQGAATSGSDFIDRSDAPSGSCTTVFGSPQN